MITNVVCVLVLLQITKPPAAQAVVCENVAGYDTFANQRFVNVVGDCVTLGGLSQCFEYCNNLFCVVFEWNPSGSNCCYFDTPSSCADLRDNVGNCVYAPQGLCPTDAPTDAPTLPQITDFISCSLKDRTLTLQITENEQNTAKPASEDVGSDISCEEFWDDLEKEVADYEEFNLEDVGVCNIEGSDVPLTVSLYKLADIAKCVAPPGEKMKLVSSMADIDLPDYKEVADVFIFSIQYTLSSDSPCKNEIDETSSMSCEWFDVEKQEFTSSGCELVETKMDGLDVTGICECRHLTAFAILHDTIKYKDTCNASNVFGNPIWIVYIILYSLVMTIALVQIRYIFGVKKSLKDFLSSKFFIHFLIVFICILNISIAATFLQVNPIKPGNSSIGSIFVAWSTLYVLSFWTYSIVVYNWASIYHMDLGKALHKYANYFFLLACAIIAILISVVFITAASSDEDDLNANVQIGSIMIGVICLLFALAYVCYGVLIVRKLNEVSHAVIKSNDPVKAVIKRLTKVTFVCFVMFIGQTIIVLISLAADEIFFSDFTVFQSVYVIFDISLLLAMMWIFYDVIRRQYYKKKESNVATA